MDHRASAQSVPRELQLMYLSSASSGAAESDLLLVHPGSDGEAPIPDANQEEDANEIDEAPQGCQVKITLSAEETAKLEELCAQYGITAKAAMFRVLLTQAVNVANKQGLPTGAIVLEPQVLHGAIEFPATQPSIDIPITNDIGNAIRAKAEERAVAIVTQQLVQAASTNISEQEADSNP